MYSFTKKFIVRFLLIINICCLASQAVEAALSNAEKKVILEARRDYLNNLLKPTLTATDTNVFTKIFGSNPVYYIRNEIRKVWLDVKFDSKSEDPKSGDSLYVLYSNQLANSSQKASNEDDFISKDKVLHSNILKVKNRLTANTGERSTGLNGWLNYDSKSIDELYLEAERNKPVVIDASGIKNLAAAIRDNQIKTLDGMASGTPLSATDPKGFADIQNLLNLVSKDLKGNPPSTVASAYTDLQKQVSDLQRLVSTAVNYSTTSQADANSMLLQVQTKWKSCVTSYQQVFPAVTNLVQILKSIQTLATSVGQGTMTTTDGSAPLLPTDPKGISDCRIAATYYSPEAKSRLDLLNNKLSVDANFFSVDPTLATTEYKNLMAAWSGCVSDYRSVLNNFVTAIQKIIKDINNNSLATTSPKDFKGLNQLKQLVSFVQNQGIADSLSADLKNVLKDFNSFVSNFPNYSSKYAFGVANSSTLADVLADYALIQKVLDGYKLFISKWCP